MNVPSPDQSYDVPEEPPTEQGGDIARKLIKAGVSAVPAVGGPVAELLDLLQPSIDRRRDDWLHDIAQELNRVRQRVKNLEDRDIFSDDSFTTSLLNASTIAIRTHQDEKREALRNAVLNTALRNEPDEDVQATFLALVDRFTPWHIRILSLFDDPKRWFERHGLEPTSGPRAVLEKAFPQLRGRDEFYSQLIADMASAGLIGGGFLNVMMTSEGAMASRTTPWGRRFLKFVSAPEE